MGEHVPDRFPHPEGVVLNEGVHYIGNAGTRPRLL